jgi:hypothetical protein
VLQLLGSVTCFYEGLAARKLKGVRILTKCLVLTVIFLTPFAVLVDAEIYSIPVWLSLFYCTFLVWKMLYLEAEDYLLTSFVTFFYVFMVLAAIIQTAAGQFPWFGFYKKEFVDLAWWITFFALLAFDVGYVIAKHRLARSLIMKESKKVLSKNGIFWLFIIAISTSAFGVFSLGFSSLFIARSDLSAIVSSNAGGSIALAMMTGTFTRVPSVLILLMLMNDLLEKIRSKQYSGELSGQLLVFITLLLVVVIVNNPISTPRFWVGAIFLSVIISFMLQMLKKAGPLLFVLNLAILLLVFPLMDVFRRTVDVNIWETIAQVDPEYELLASPDFDAFQQQLNTVEVVDSNGPSYGLQVLSSLLFFVPRSIWNDKADATGSVVAGKLGYTFFNLSEPLSAEFYIDAKLPGVIVGMLFLGYMYRWVHHKLMLRENLSVSLYCLFCAYQIYFLRGSLMSVIGYIAVALLLAYFISRFEFAFYELSRDKL